MTLSNEKIQDYIDGRLSTRERAVVAATLIANPERMQEVTRLRMLNEMMRCIGLSILSEPVPDRLTETLRSARSKLK